MEKKYFLLEKGQTVVEYILLLAVVMSLVTAMYKSKYFKNFFGETGQFATAFKAEMEFSYRNAFGARIPGQPLKYTDKSHPSYYNTDKGASRFFTPKEPYPKNF
jgi:hypothetical protein